MKLLFAVILFLSYLQVSSQVRFENLSIEDGLSQNSVTAILQDHQGHLWLGTEHGLNKYNGYKFEVYTSENSKGALCGNQVWSLYQDKSNRLFIGTDGGFCQYDFKLNQFTSLLSESNKTISGVVSAIYEDDKNNLWLGTWHNGIYKLDSTRNNIQHFLTMKETGTSMAYGLRDIVVIEGWLYGTTWDKGLLKLSTVSGEYSYFTTESSDLKNDHLAFFSTAVDSLLWVSTRSGIQRFDYSQERFLSTGNDDLDNLLFAGAMTLIDNTLWIASYGKGLYFYNKETESVIKQPASNGLSSNLIIDIIKDHSGCIWVSTWSGGLNKYCPDLQKFNCCNSVTHDYSIFSIKEIDEEIFLGTYGKGLFREEGHELKQLNDPSEFILDMLVSSKNELFIAYDGAGLAKWNDKKNRAELVEEVSSQLGSLHIHRLMEDRQNRLWLGTHGAGAYVFEDGFQFNLNTSTSPSLSNNFIYSFLEDSKGRVFMGTYGGGLNIYDPDTHTIEKFEKRERDNALQSNNVWDIYEDSKNVIWLATSVGFSKFQHGEFKTYKKANGLIDNWVYCILEDDGGVLWLSTNGGLSAFDPESESFVNYQSDDGLQSNEFNANAKFKDADGNLYFGGINGYNKFHPESISLNKTVPKAVFTSLSVNGKLVDPDNPNMRDQNVIASHISQRPKVILNHTHKTLSIEFAALHYLKPQNNTYKYKMVGFENEWIESGTRNFVTYTNLDPGQYSFTVLAANSDGVWNDNEVPLSITVLPPPWRTWWAYLIYLIILTLLSFLIIRVFIIRERLKNKIKLERLEIEKMKEVDLLKTRFFTNISHEFRTPLTLILAPVRQLIRNTTNKQKKRDLGIVERNAKRLLGLINEILDLSKLEAGHLKLSISKNDLIEFLNEITAPFDFLAQSRNIEFIKGFPQNPQTVYFDKSKMEKVINNLLSNAFKYTDNINYVSITAEVTNGVLEVVVENSGVTLSLTELSSIFNRFHQITDNDKGTGVGLALVKELLSLHKGSIDVDSKNGVTSFLVCIPAKKEAYSGNEVVDNETRLTVEVGSEAQELELSEKEVNQDIQKQLILIVEDNEDLRNYLKGHLQQNYTVKTASDGKKGLEIAANSIPDLVVSDFMMPQMDGMEMLQELRTDHKTSHIPVIMLTAKVDFESKMSGLLKGADHYMTKPFELEELAVLIKNLLIKRERVLEHYRIEFLTGPTNTDYIASADDVFLEKVKKILDARIQDAEFSVEMFASELAMSRVQLHRKLKAAIGCSASDFIRQYRLKRAYYLLSNKKGNVSEVAYDVGFNNLSYFAKCFKDQYSINPSELSNQ